MEFRKRCLLILILVGCALVLGGCGGGGSPSDEVLFYRPPIEPEVQASSLLGSYNTLSVRYLPSRTSGNLVYYTDVLYSENGYQTITPVIFPSSASEFRLIGYNFPVGSKGEGRQAITTSALESVIETSIYTEASGGFAFFGLGTQHRVDPFLTLQMKGYSDQTSLLTTVEFDGQWGYVSVNTSGRAVIADLVFKTNGMFGVSEGVGFSSTAVGAISFAAALPVTSATFFLNANRKELKFLDANWFVQVTKRAAISHENPLTHQGDRISVLLRPIVSSNAVVSSDPIHPGTYAMMEWNVFSQTSAMPALLSSGMNGAEVAVLSKVEFKSGSATLRNLQGISMGSYSYEAVPGTKTMWRFLNDANSAGTRQMRFFVSSDSDGKQRYLVGADFANDKDARVSFWFGIRQQ